MPKNGNQIYFSKDLTNKERACFETGIKLGALYHILCGIPITSNYETIKSIEKGIESAILCQPFVQSVKIELDRNKILREKSNPYDYDEITGKIIRAEVIIKYENVDVVAKIDWIEKMQYPLMFIEKINENKL